MMIVDKESEEKVNVVQYQPYEDEDYSDISSVLKHYNGDNKLYLGNIFSATDRLILEYYKIKVVISIVDNDKIDLDLLNELGIEHIVYKAEDKEDDNVA